MVLVSPEETRYIGATDSLRKRQLARFGHLVGWWPERRQAWDSR